MFHAMHHGRKEGCVICQLRRDECYRRAGIPVAILASLIVWGIVLWEAFRLM